MPVTLGFDTSCYTTSIAAVDTTGNVVVSARKLLPVAHGNRGLRQSEAVFAHVKQISEVAHEAGEALKAAGESVVAVCASQAPRDDEASYMPVFTVGLSHAQVLAQTLHVPLYLTSHQRGHIAAGQIGNPPMDKRFIALHLSGGTTELMDCDGGALRLIGGSLDLHAGQLVDRVGVSMGLGFPAGAELEKLAMRGQAASALPVSMDGDGLHCHLSGAEAQAARMLNAGNKPNEDIAAEVFDLLARTVARMLQKGAYLTGARQALVVGGVASSTLLRQMIEARLLKLRSPLQVLYGQPRFSADNAAGVASIGMQRYTMDRREL